MSAVSVSSILQRGGQRAHSLHLPFLAVKDPGGVFYVGCAPADSCVEPRMESKTRASLSAGVSRISQRMPGIMTQCIHPLLSLPLSLSLSDCLPLSSSTLEKTPPGGAWPSLPRPPQRRGPRHTPPSVPADSFCHLPPQPPRGASFLARSARRASKSHRGSRPMHRG
jgi:hypothetical protein